MNTQLSAIERLAEVALKGATHPARIKSWRCRVNYTDPHWINPRSLRVGQSEAAVLERAIIRTFLFEDHLNQTVLYLLRQMEMTQGYRDLGYETMNDWAYGRLGRFRNPDTLSRLCAVTTKVITVLDAQPIILPDTGEKVTGLTLLANASVSALIRHAGRFVNADDRTALVAVWMTGTSDDHRLRASTGDEMEKAEGVVHNLIDDDVEMVIRGKSKHFAIIQKQLDWMIDWRFEE